MLPVRIKQVSKRFGDTIAVDSVDLEIESGELFALLGPSGCGKTTLMRLLAGLEVPDTGSIHLGNTRIDREPTHRRQIAMVFQNYALFPHMTVYENVAYGLKAQRAPLSRVAQRVTEALSLVQMSAYGTRRPDQLSGGQQQRVALARALAPQPAIVLMDEPLSNLDPPLRIAMRTEIRQIQRKIGLTTLYVTHDQEEALAISDRIAVMDRGRLLQVGSPTSIYRHPRNCTVACFVGSCSFINAQLRDGNFHVGGCQIPRTLVPTEAPDVIVGLRPEALRFRRQDHPQPSNEPVLSGIVEEAVFQGSFSAVQVRLSTDELVTALAMEPGEAPSPGSRVALSFRMIDALLFNAETKESV